MNIYICIFHTVLIIHIRARVCVWRLSSLPSGYAARVVSVTELQMSR